MTRFVRRGLIALAIVAIATVLVARVVAERGALQEARGRGEAFTRGVVAPLVDKRLRGGDTAATAEFAKVMHNRLRIGSIRHMKLWDTQGQLLWSDQPGLATVSYGLEREIAQRAGTTFSRAAIPDLSRPEHVTERHAGKLLEVSVGTLDADGVPMIFETYWSAERVDQDERQLMLMMAPLSLGGLGLLLLMMVPLGSALAGGLARSDSERQRWLRHALSASDLERRRMAQVLHDDVIQDLAGLGYALPAALGPLARSPETEPIRGLLQEAGEVLQHDVATLRSILSDIYTPSLTEGNLALAIQQIADKAVSAGIDIHASLPGAERLPPAAGQLAYRIVREGLTNVIQHSGAAQAWVSLNVVGAKVQISVRDNGPTTDVRITESASSHFGLRLLHDVVTDLGGAFSLTAISGGGALLSASFPVDL